MKKRKTKKVLLIAQENFFGSVEGCRIDFFATGYPFTPMPDKYHNTAGAIIRMLFNIVSRNYDIMVLPTPNLNYTSDKSLFKKKIRGIVSRLIHSKTFGNIVRFFTRRSKVIVVDRFAISTVQLDYWKMFGPDSDYYTTNLSKENYWFYNFSKDKPQVGNLYHLPLYIYTRKYNAPKNTPKDIDVFFSGVINSDARREALPALELLKAKGYKIEINTGRLNLQQYLHEMSRSILCLSPGGLGYDCFRHYEIMLCSSVPLINANEEEAMHPLEHGRNCFIYKNADDLVAQVEALLQNPQQLIEMGRHLEKEVHETNDIYVIGHEILSKYINPETKTKELHAVTAY